MAVNLVGVVHCADQTDIFGRKKPVPLSPSDGFIDFLAELPSSRIGIEWLKEGDWEEVNNHLSDTLIKEGLPPDSVYYPSAHNNYWNSILNRCNGVHELFLLESKELWFKQNLASIEIAKKKFELADLCQKGGESDFDYNVRLCNINDGIFRAQLFSRKILEIDRDGVLLKAINKNNLDLAIVGMGHSEFWMANRDLIKKKFGILLGEYFVDRPMSPRCFYLAFDENHSLDDSLVYSRTALERTIHFLEKGRFSSKKPNYIGVWDVNIPSRGYFEIFVEEIAGNNIRGTIEDCLGLAEFYGICDENTFIFDKKYVKSAPDAIKDVIKYEAQRNGRGFHGYYWIQGFGTAFYFKEFSGETPLDLVKYWDEVVEEKKENQPSPNLKDDDFEEGDLPF